MDELPQTSEARIPAADDGLLRGDGVFEVIRLYAGRPFALGEHLDRLERSAAAIELPIERPAFEEEISALLAEFGEHEAQLRLVADARRPAPRLHREPAALRGRRVDQRRDGHVLAERDPERRQVALLRRQHAGDPAGRGRGRGRGGPGPPRRGRPRGADVDHLLGHRDGRLRTPSLEVGILASITRDRLVRELDVEEGAFQLEDLAGTERGLPRLDRPGGPGRSRRSMRQSCQNVPATGPPRKPPRRSPRSSIASSPPPPELNPSWTSS